MASTPSSNSSTTYSTTTTTSSLVNPSLLLLSNMSSMMTGKLNFTNYIVWKHQIIVILEAYAMIGFLDDSCVAPDHFLKYSSGNFTREPNPKYINWRSREQALFTFINSTLSPSVLALTVGQRSAKGVWNVLEKRFASVSRSHVLSLRNELLSIKKGPKSMDNFFQRIKEARDRLSSIVVFVDEEELIHLFLKALPNEYSAFCSTIRTRNDVVTIEELNTLLNAEERAIKKKSVTRDTAIAMLLQSGFNQNTTKGRGRNGNQRGRGRGFNNFGPNFGFNNGQSSGQSSGSATGILQLPTFQHKSGSGFPSFQSEGSSQSSRPTCQICDKNGHIAYQGRHAPSKLASMATSSMVASSMASIAYLLQHIHQAGLLIQGVLTMLHLISLSFL